MRIEVVDPGGHGVGLAIGMVELGHDVHYVGGVRREPEVGEAADMHRALVGRFFGEQQGDAGQRDLVVLVDAFADYLRALELGYGHGEANPYHHPLQTDAGVLVYPHRLRYFAARAAAAEEVVVVDMSDAHGPREVAFEVMPRAHLFAREAGVGESWRPLPFLYNEAMLWLEYVCEGDGWFVPSAQRPIGWDWAFCGTVDHERYAGSRIAALQAIAARWPTANGLVRTGVCFRDVLATLQSARCGLDLAGAGELCFRVHECLALGVPVWRPFAARVQLPDGLAAAVVRDIDELSDASPEQVRALYRQHYAPRAAAAHLLESAQYSISQATSIAPAASR